MRAKRAKNKKHQRPLRVYVCSSLRPRTVARVDRIIAELATAHKAATGRDVRYFRPRGTDPSKIMVTVREDVAAIKWCDELWVVGRYGRDCSLEMGFAAGIGKKIRIYRDKTNCNRLSQDWMARFWVETGQTTIEDLDNVF